MCANKDMLWIYMYVIQFGRQYFIGGVERGKGYEQTVALAMW